MGTALLTFSIGPVQTFIAQARRVADLWAGSDLLSHLTTSSFGPLKDAGGRLVFPLADFDSVPEGFPNRFVAEIPLEDAAKTAGAMGEAIRVEWRRLVAEAVGCLAERGIRVHPSLWSSEEGRSQADNVFEVAWSFVPLDSYEEASTVGAARFAQSRLFRPFAQIREMGEKCAVCGERTALPDGDRVHVRDAWLAAEERPPDEDKGFYRADQTKLCLVCATKRLFPKIVGRPARFKSFQDFEPKVTETKKLPYFALVALDGDHMGQVLGWTREVHPRQARAFHGDLSAALNQFAAGLRCPGSNQDLNLVALGLAGEEFWPRPQLIYAGGDDVLLVCGARAALPIAHAIRKTYVDQLRAAVKPHLVDEALAAGITTSGAILYAHSKDPAGLLFRDLHDLLSRKAKSDEGRDALALRLDKRGGVPVEVAFKWDAQDDSPDLAELDRLVGLLKGRELASRQSFSLRDDERHLRDAFGGDSKRWKAWIAERLSRAETRGREAEEVADVLTPFFVHRKTEALRIARFLAREVAS